MASLFIPCLLGFYQDKYSHSLQHWKLNAINLIQKNQIEIHGPVELSYVTNLKISLNVDLLTYMGVFLFRFGRLGNPTARLTNIYDTSLESWAC